MKVTTLLFAAFDENKTWNLRKIIVFLLVCRRFMKRFSEVLSFIKLVQHEATVVIIFLMFGADLVPSLYVLVWSQYFWLQFPLWFVL